MNRDASTVTRPLGVSGSVSSSLEAATMSKKYQVFRRKSLLPEGGIDEFSCLGERRFDLSGYPHESELDAFAEDWAKLAEDANVARKNLKEKTK